MKKPQPSWLTTTPAAVYCGVQRCAMWRWANTGVIPSNALLRVGTRVRIAAWWAKQQQGVAHV